MCKHVRKFECDYIYLHIIMVCGYARACACIENMPCRLPVHPILTYRAEPI